MASTYIYILQIKITLKQLLFIKLPYEMLYMMKTEATFFTADILTCQTH